MPTPEQLPFGQGMVAHFRWQLVTTYSQLWTVNGSGTFYGMGIISATVHTMASSSTETMKPLVPYPQYHLQALPEDDSRMVFSQHV